MLVSGERSSGIFAPFEAINRSIRNIRYTFAWIEWITAVCVEVSITSLSDYVILCRSIGLYFWIVCFGVVSIYFGLKGRRIRPRILNIVRFVHVIHMIWRLFFDSLWVYGVLWSIFIVVLIECDFYHFQWHWYARHLSYMVFSGYIFYETCKIQLF